MRPIVILSSFGLSALVASALACSGSPSDTGFNGSSGSGSGGSGSSGGGSNGSGSGSGNGGSNSGGGSGSFGSSGSGSGGSSDAGGDAIVTVKTTVYAHTDSTLYSVDPMTQAVTMIGPMVGVSDASTDSSITDLAVNGSGDVYVNSETVLYKAALPSGGTGTVQLTRVATISVSSGTSRFYALAFAPAGALDPNNETLIGGDSSGSLYAINTTTGAATNLGNFGKDASGACGQGTCTFELSGDIVFYSDANNTPTGLATIRSCSSGSYPTCSADWLAGVNMANLKTAYTSGSAASSLLAGIYGGSGANLGPGTGFHDVFGLGAWNSTVFGFTRHMTSPTQSPTLVTINPMSGTAAAVGSPFPFTDGWSGAGVTTKVTIMVPPPPPPPPNNQ